MNLVIDILEMAEILLKLSILRMEDGYIFLSPMVIRSF